MSRLSDSIPSKLGLGAGRDNHGLGFVRVLPRLDAEGTPAEVDLGDLDRNALGAEAFGLLPEPLHHLGSLQTLGKPDSSPPRWLW